MPQWKWKAAVGAGALASLWWAAGAWGGMRADPNYPVAVSSESQVAYGYVGAARNSSDDTQYIYCAPIGAWLSCGAVDTAGNGVFCTSNNPDLVRAAGSVTSSSFIYFAGGGPNGACTYIQVNQYSFAPPKKP